MVGDGAGNTKVVFVWVVARRASDGNRASLSGATAVIPAKLVKEPTVDGTNSTKAPWRPHLHALCFFLHLLLLLACSIAFLCRRNYRYSLDNPQAAASDSSPRQEEARDAPVNCPIVTCYTL